MRYFQYNLLGNNIEMSVGKKGARDAEKSDGRDIYFTDAARQEATGPGQTLTSGRKDFIRRNSAR